MKRKTFGKPYGQLRHEIKSLDCREIKRRIPTCHLFKIKIVLVMTHIYRGILEESRER